ncbi:MAG TPA: phenylacetate--CoA ligase family protein, partial [Candidatus Binatia bacterium]|nr:phenylacetate--CoA ligase family protein [Candidatus Binatia bacterium]
MGSSSRKAIEQEQFKRLRQMFQTILPANKFYGRKLARMGLQQLDSPEQLRSLPFTTKSELVEDQQNHPPFGSDL